MEPKAKRATVLVTNKDIICRLTYFNDSSLEPVTAVEQRSGKKCIPLFQVLVKTAA